MSEGWFLFYLRTFCRNKVFLSPCCRVKVVKDSGEAVFQVGASPGRCETPASTSSVWDAAGRPGLRTRPRPLVAARVGRERRAGERQALFSKGGVPLRTWQPVAWPAGGLRAVGWAADSAQLRGTSGVLQPPPRLVLNTVTPLPVPQPPATAGLGLSPQTGLLWGLPGDPRDHCLWGGGGGCALGWTAAALAAGRGRGQAPARRRLPAPQSSRRGRPAGGLPPPDSRGRPGLSSSRGRCAALPPVRCRVWRAALGHRQTGPSRGCFPRGRSQEAAPGPLPRTWGARTPRLAGASASPPGGAQGSRSASCVSGRTPRLPEAGGSGCSSPRAGRGETPVPASAVGTDSRAVCASVSCVTGPPARGPSVTVLSVRRRVVVREPWSHSRPWPSVVAGHRAVGDRRGRHSGAGHRCRGKMGP